ncbi:MAG TPA: CHAT domain-containing protein [Streptomyces sp.]
MIDASQALVESLGVMRAVTSGLGRAPFDCGPLLNVFWLHFHRATTGAIDLPHTDLLVAGVLRILFEEHLPDQAARLPAMGLAGEPHAPAEAYCGLVSLSVDRLAQDVLLSDVAEAVLELAGATTTDRALQRHSHRAAGHLLYKRYLIGKDIGHLTQAVERLRKAADPVVRDDTDPGPLSDTADWLGTGAYYLYRATHDVELLVESVDSHALALRLGPAYGSRRAAVLDNLGASLHALALVRRDPATLRRSLNCFAEAAESSGADAPGRWQAVDKMWRTLEVTCRICRTHADLDAALEQGDALLERYGEHDPGLGQHLLVQAGLMHDRLVLTTEVLPELLDRYVALARRACTALPAEHPDRARANANIGVALAMRFTRLGDPADGADAVGILRAAAEEQPDEPTVQHNLLVVETYAQNRPGTGAPAESADRVGMLASGANHLGAAYAMFDNPMFLSEAIHRAEEALQAATPEHRQYCELHRVLAELWQDEAQRTGAAEALDRAADYARHGAAAAQDGSPDRAALDSVLAHILRSRFEQRGVLADIQEAVRLATGAASAASEDFGRAIALNRLGLALVRRYEHNRDLADAQAAVDIYAEAVGLSTDHPQLRASLLSNMSSAYAQLFWHHRDRSWLEQSVACLRECIRLTPRSSTFAATRWDNLARALNDLYVLSSSPDHLAEALTHAEQAVEATGHEHVEHARRLARLSSLLAERHRVTGKPADLSRAVAQARAATRSPAADHLHRAEFLNNLGHVLLAGLQRSDGAVPGQALAVLDEVLSVFDQARRHHASLVHLRGAAAINWAKARAATGGTRDAIEGAEYAFDLLEQIDWHGMTLADRLTVLRSWDGFARGAAGWALQLGDAARAVKLLERGRGLLWSQLTSHAGELDRLTGAHPELAEEFQAVRREARELTDSAGAARGERLAHINDEHRRLVSQIRALDGFDSFLGPPSPDRLRAAIGEGAVVVLNVTGDRCDAVVLVGSRARAVPLGVRGDAVVEQTQRWAAVVRAAQAARRELIARKRAGRPAAKQIVVAHRTAIDEMRELLGWGWEALTGPVLEALGHDQPFRGGRSWPRVWWCPTGPLTAFPLAATGHHDGSGRAVIDRVVSSEAPTLRSLADAQARATRQGVPHLLAVSVPRPCDRDDTLPGVEEEYAAVLHATPLGVTALSGPAATRAALIRALAQCTHFHFAGHGVSSATDPVGSALSAFDAPLRMTDLAGLPVNTAELAYLSTCHGATASAAHPDEVLHLAAALHTVGFRHVIAARQEIDDRVAADTAAAFHRHLALVPDPGVALHEAVRAVRDRLMADEPEDWVSPWDWAGFVHVGPVGTSGHKE